MSKSEKREKIEKSRTSGAESALTAWSNGPKVFYCLFQGQQHWRAICGTWLVSMCVPSKQQVSCGHSPESILSISYRCFLTRATLEWLCVCVCEFAGKLWSRVVVGNTKSCRTTFTKHMTFGVNVLQSIQAILVVKVDWIGKERSNRVPYMSCLVDLQIEIWWLISLCFSLANNGNWHNFAEPENPSQ